MIYFAYDADLNPARMAERAPAYKTIGVASLADHWFCFPRWSPVERSATMSMEKSPGSMVWGVLYEIAVEDEPILHHHHGYTPDAPPEINEQTGSEFEVQEIARSRTVSAFSYMAIPDEGLTMPSPAYLSLVLDGARYHRLPRSYRAALQSVRVEGAA